MSDYTSSSSWTTRHDERESPLFRHDSKNRKKGWQVSCPFCSSSPHVISLFQERCLTFLSSQTLTSLWQRVSHIIFRWISLYGSEEIFDERETEPNREDESFYRNESASNDGRECSMRVCVCHTVVRMSSSMHEATHQTVVYSLTLACNFEEGLKYTHCFYLCCCSVLMACEARECSSSMAWEEAGNQRHETRRRNKNEQDI